MTVRTLWCFTEVLCQIFHWMPFNYLQWYGMHYFMGIYKPLLPMAHESHHIVFVNGWLIDFTIHRMALCLSWVCGNGDGHLKPHNLLPYCPLPNGWALHELNGVFPLWNIMGCVDLSMGAQYPCDTIDTRASCVLTYCIVGYCRVTLLMYPRCKCGWHCVTTWVCGCGDG